MKIYWPAFSQHPHYFMQNKNKRRKCPMSRFTGSMWKKSRRLGISLTGTGKELSKRPYAPGQHGAHQRRKISAYALQQQGNPKMRFMYGVKDRRSRTLFNEAGKTKRSHGDNFMILLESTRDNLVFRLALARTPRQARQLVNHGHVTVDGRRVDIPPYRVNPNQVIGVR